MMPARCPNPLEIPLAMPEQLVRDLAMLCGAPPGTPESTVALLRFGTRTLLEELGLVEIVEAPPRHIRITNEGWRVIEACSHWVQHASDEDWQAYRQAHEQD
jgi:hypothetical protein